MLESIKLIRVQCIWVARQDGHLLIWSALPILKITRSSISAHPLPHISLPVDVFISSNTTLKYCDLRLLKLFTNLMFVVSNQITIKLLKKLSLQNTCNELGDSIVQSSTLNASRMPAFLNSRSKCAFFSNFINNQRVLQHHNIFTPQLGCPKIILDHVRVYLYIYMFVCTTMLKYTLYWKYMNWGCTSNRNTSSSWYM